MHSSIYKWILRMGLVGSEHLYLYGQGEHMLDKVGLGDRGIRSVVNGRVKA